MISRYRGLIGSTVTPLGLDPKVVEAVVWQESGDNTDAFRWEPDFYNRYLKLSPDWAWARDLYHNPRRISSSYGLMQIMWPTALEVGYLKTLPPEMLFIPETGLAYGCKQLKRLMDWADKGWPQVAPDLRLHAVLASYNGGRGGNVPGTSLRNGRYALSVLNKLTQLT